MRPLTTDEMDIVAGGDDVSATVTVTGTKGGGGFYAPMPGGGGGGGSTGGGGAGVSPYGNARAGHIHITKNGNSYTPGVSLNADQTTNLDKIVDYGISHHFSNGDIRTVASATFLESSLNTSPNNPTHTGLGQYSQDTWNDLHEAGSINNSDDQVAALYHDLQLYQGTYSTATQNDSYGINESGLNSAEYFEYKHHYGRSATNWQQTDPDSGQTAKQQFDNAYNTLNLQ